MATWNHFAAEEPELAGRARSILVATTNAVLATVRRDGSPRISGIDPFFVDGDLWIGSMPGARKGDDLRRDPRLALHAIPWESRRVRDGADDPGDADAKLSGRAVLERDPDRAARVLASFGSERGAEPPGPADLFRIELDAVVVVWVADEELVIDRWSAADGRVVRRRT